MTKDEAVTKEGGVRGVVGGEAAEVNDDKGGDGDKGGWGARCGRWRDSQSQR